MFVRPPSRELVAKGGCIQYCLAVKSVGGGSFPPHSPLFSKSRPRGPFSSAAFICWMFLLFSSLLCCISQFHERRRQKFRSPLCDFPFPGNLGGKKVLSVGPLMLCATFLPLAGKDGSGSDLLTQPSYFLRPAKLSLSPMSSLGGGRMPCWREAPDRRRSLYHLVSTAKEKFFFFSSSFIKCRPPSDVRHQKWLCQHSICCVSSEVS